MKSFCLQILKVFFLALLSSLPAISPVLAEIGTEASPLRIGSISPLSGDFAKGGVEVRDGVVLAVEDLRKRGVFIKAVFEDGCLPADVVRISKKLIDEDRIQGIAASYCVIGTTAVAPLFEAKKIPFFHTCPVSDSIVNSGDFIFTTNVVIRNEARQAAEYVFKTMELKTAFVLGLETQWGEDFARYFTKAFEEVGGKVIGQATDPIGAHDFRSELTKIRAAKPDVVFAAHAGLMLGNLLKQARQLGVTTQFVAPDEAEDPTVLQVAGVAAENMILFSPSPDPSEQKFKDFRSSFYAKFNREPNTLSENSYDATILLAESLISCGGDSDCTKSRIYGVQNFDGVSGRFSIESDGGTQKPFRTKKVVGGKFVNVAEDIP